MKRAQNTGSNASMSKKASTISIGGHLQHLNTNKAMTSTSMVPQEVKASGSTLKSSNSKGDVEAKKGVGAVPPFVCKICRSKPIPYEATHIVRHEAGKRHKKLQDLLEKEKVLQAWGIVLVDGDAVKYMCVACDLEMELSFQKMEKHFEVVHKLPLPTSEVPTLEVTKVYRRKKFYETSYDFEMDKVHFTLANGSVCIQESTALSKNSIGILRKEVIPKNGIRELYGMASILEQLGRPIKRGKNFFGTKMVMYGMFEHAQLGWFVQPYSELYELSERFVKKMASYFTSAFPEVMSNFKENLTNEGLSTTEGHFGGTPFTSFAITRDYTCLPHDDPNDYGFGIIVWLHPNGEVEVEEQPLFWLPEYKIHFRCGNGDAFICNAKTTVHCTTSPKPIGVLGMAFVQHRPFVVQLSKALKNPSGILAKNYFEARKRYFDDRDANAGKGVAAVFC